MTVLQVNSCSIDQKSGEICTVQADLQPISFKPDRLLAIRLGCKKTAAKSPVIQQAGRAQRGGRSQANESLREFHVNAAT